jgi:predicted dinucleotide-utilizing enzyme
MDEKQKIESEIEEQIKSAIPELMARVRKQALESIERQAAKAATDIAVEAAKEWATEHLVPEIVAQLNAGKDGFVSAANEAAKRIGAALTDALVESATKTLSNSYTVREIAEKVFKGY